MNSLTQRFNEIVTCYPQKIAIRFCDGSTISFSELNALSNKIANFLLNQEMASSDVLAIANHKSRYGFAAMIACLKLGIIYTNYDYTNPQDRIEKMFATACPKLVIDDNKLWAQIESFDDRLSLPELPDDQPAYIMFTSGSTGMPKGVLIKQSALLRFLDWAKGAYGLRESDIMTNLNPIYFDNSVFDFYCSIFNGITMAAIPKETVAEPKALIDAVNSLGCTFWFSVPSLLIYLANMKLLLPGALTTIRAFAFGGEGYPKPLLKKLIDTYSDCEFYNVYGPTEGTCICSAYRIRPEHDLKDLNGFVTLGSIAPIFEYKIVDDELWLGGPQIALGYYNDPERTEKSFIDGWYKTGDLVETVDGKLFFKGRSDHQIKHMGYRVELEEIEAGLIRLPYVRQCAVVHGKNRFGFSHIVAYIAVEEPQSEMQVRSNLSAILPQYMIPNRIEMLDELPKNQNGKVDRVALAQRAILT